MSIETGQVHGAAFLAYVALTVLCARRFGWSLRVLALGIASSLPPFTTLLFDAWLERSGKFADEAAAVVGEPSSGASL